MPTPLHNRVGMGVARRHDSITLSMDMKHRARHMGLVIPVEYPREGPFENGRIEPTELLSEDPLQGKSPLCKFRGKRSAAELQYPHRDEPKAWPKRSSKPRVKGKLGWGADTADEQHGEWIEILGHMKCDDPPERCAANDDAAAGPQAVGEALRVRIERVRARGDRPGRNDELRKRQLLRTEEDSVSGKPGKQN